MTPILFAITVALLVPYDEHALWETADPDLHFGIHGFTSTISPYPPDHIWYVGYNVHHGNPLDNSEPSLAWAWESEWLGGFEHYLQYRSADGSTEKRPIGVGVNKSTHNTAVALAGLFAVVNEQYTESRIQVLLAGTGQPTVVAIGNVSTWTALRFEQNNAPMMYGLNAAGTAFHELVRYDASDSLSFGRPVKCTELAVNGTDVGAKLDELEARIAALEE
jgi:hypothetical protein